MADLKTPPQFAGECIGVSLTNRGANDSHKIVSLFIEDDGNWHPKAAFSQHWLAEAIRVLQDAQAAITGRATPAPGAPGQEAADDRKIVETYEKLHEGKLGAHWLWCVIEQIAAGVPEAEAMRGFGYYEPGAGEKTS